MRWRMNGLQYISKCIIYGYYYIYRIYTFIPIYAWAHLALGTTRTLFAIPLLLLILLLCLWLTMRSMHSTAQTPEWESRKKIAECTQQKNEILFTTEWLRACSMCTQISDQIPLCTQRTAQRAKKKRLLILFILKIFK